MSLLFLSSSCEPSSLEIECTEVMAQTVQAPPMPSYELDPVLAHQSEDNFGSNPGREFSLAPVDRGKDAWLCLMGGFCLEVMVWGKLLWRSGDEILTLYRIPVLFWCLARLLYFA